MITLNLIWFALVAVLLVGYAILDGFDLGVGAIHLFTKDKKEKQANINAVGPVWDGNEVWLLTAGGALFAAFPRVYATVFSSFYTALMLLLAALIFRAVSFEFRERMHLAVWTRFWDRAFGLGSLTAALLLGLALGNILRGLPIDSAGVYGGSFFGLLNPYALIVGLIAVGVFIMHGALYMALKTGGAQRERMTLLAQRCLIVVALLYLVHFISSFFAPSEIFKGIFSTPLFYLMLLILLAGLVLIPMSLKKAQYGRAFLGSAAAIAGMLGIAAVGLFPNMVPSSTGLANSLTVFNASSTAKTHTVMLAITLIGMPIVIGYTIFVYRVFKGKVNGAA